jgi:predicted XRE-type DNA-binding protein
MTRNRLKKMAASDRAGEEKENMYIRQWLVMRTRNKEEQLPLIQRLVIASIANKMVEESAEVRTTPGLERMSI